MPIDFAPPSPDLSPPQITPATYTSPLQSAQALQTLRNTQAQNAQTQASTTGIGLQNTMTQNQISDQEIIRQNMMQSGHAQMQQQAQPDAGLVTPVAQAPGMQYNPAAGQGQNAMIQAPAQAQQVPAVPQGALPGEPPQVTAARARMASYSAAPRMPSASPRVTSQAQFDALPSGAIYIGSDGVTQYRKP
jgi:hypothetical protein